MVLLRFEPVWDPGADMHPGTHLKHYSVRPVIAAYQYLTQRLHHNSPTGDLSRALSVPQTGISRSAMEKHALTEGGRKELRKKVAGLDAGKYRFKFQIMNVAVKNAGSKVQVCMHP
jgi:hypothetical protein